MATSVHSFKEDSAALTPQFANHASTTPESDGPVFSFIQRNRALFLTAPLWFSAILIALHTYGGSQLRAVIDFLSGISTK